jgi:hypothetical protein
MQVLFTVRRDRQRKLIGPLERRELFGRQKVFIEVLELAAAFHPDVTRAQCVLEFRQHTQFVVAPVDTIVGENEPVPALSDEADRCVFGHLTGVAEVHFTKYLDCI